MAVKNVFFKVLFALKKTILSRKRITLKKKKRFRWNNMLRKPVRPSVFFLLLLEKNQKPSKKEKNMFASKHPLCMHSKRLFSGWFVCIYIYVGVKRKEKKKKPTCVLTSQPKKRHVKFKMAACGKRINCRFFSKPPPLQSIEHLHSTHLYSFFGL